MKIFDKNYRLVNFLLIVFAKIENGVLYNLKEGERGGKKVNGMPDGKNGIEIRKEDLDGDGRSEKEDRR